MIQRFRYTLRLGNDIIKARQLRVKSRQYDERMARLEQHVINGEDPGLLFLLKHYELRQAIIAHLLYDGQVEFGQLQCELERDGHLQPSDLDSWFMACLLIIDYVLYDGLHTVGGSGLPVIKPPPAK